MFEKFSCRKFVSLVASNLLYKVLAEFNSLLYLQGIILLVFKIWYPIHPVPKMISSNMHCRLPRPFLHNIMKVVRRYSQQKSKELGEIKTNPYYEKYSQKIAALQQTSPEEFLQRVKGVGKNKSSSNVMEESSEVKSISKHPQKAQLHHNPGYTKQKTLDSIVKTELLKEQSPEEISRIWQEYHKKKKGITAVIPATIFEKMSSYSKEFPIFLYPLPRKEGYEFILGQFLGYECHFTPLINFQAYKEDAPSCLNITHYADFQTDKGIVLMHGEFDDKLLTPQEAQCLANQVQIYYTGNSTRKLNLLRTFNKSPQNFRHMDLINEFESIQSL